MASHADARLVFDTERQAFASVMPRARTCKLVIAAKHYLARPKRRDTAWYDPDIHAITFAAPALARLNPEQLIGIIRHELGHACDPHLENAGTERRADVIAEIITGEPMRYDTDGLQSIQGRVGRPAGLPK